ncbi:helix-turn-helix domain-containing protein [Nocardioides sp. NPDC087217]|uniref:helix-turn-helix domain-containing protein n=1 Tax=Nocardioides sp. NPDC087217 TaxID=3364335 RepID=UPI0037FE56AA
MSVSVRGPSAEEVVAYVAGADPDDVADLLEPLAPQELCELVIELAKQVSMDPAISGGMTDLSPAGICTTAINAAAAAFGTTPEAVLSADRHRPITDARAVAMAAARRTGLTLPAIAAHFGRDHTVVMYAAAKVADNPRLDVACGRIVGQIAERSGVAGPLASRSGVLQDAELRRHIPEAEPASRGPAVATRRPGAPR